LRPLAFPSRHELGSPNHDALKSNAMKTSTLQRLAATVGLCAAAAGITLLAVRARAAGIPDADVLTYTGYLEGADGQPLTSELSSIGVEVWDAADAGKRVCDTSVENVTPKAGRFQLVLPAECVDAVKATPNLWIDVKVEGASLGRTKLGAVPYAIEAGHASSSDQAGSTAEATHAASADNAAEAMVAKSVAASAVRVERTCTLKGEANNSTHHYCTCAKDEVAIGGGACSGTFCTAATDALIGSERVDVDPRSWAVSCRNNAGVRVVCASPHAICLKVAP
jgi:hypothetical protein